MEEENSRRVLTKIQADMIEYLNTFLFEPLDRTTKEHVIMGTEAYLHDLMNRNVIYDYSATVQLQWWDGGNWNQGISLDTFVKPDVGGEFIHQTFVLTTSQGAQASDPIQAYDYAMRSVI